MSGCRALLLLAGALVASACAAIAQDKKPPVPPGRDPGGVAVALICTGIDYTQTALAQRLARDGEGEPIAWDVVDKNRQPFDSAKGEAPREWGGDGTALAGRLAADGLRLVAVRVDPADPASLARAVAFVAQTPARIAVVPMWGASREAWEPFRQAASHFRHLLVIVPAGEEAGPVYPAALGLDTVLAVAAGTGSGSAEVPGFGGRTRRLSGEALAVAAAGRAAAALLAREPRLDARALKERLIEAGGEPAWRPRK